MWKASQGGRSPILPLPSHLTILCQHWYMVKSSICHARSLDWKKNLVKEEDDSPHLETQRAGKKVSHEYEAGILREMSLYLLVAVSHQLSLKLGSKQTFCRLLGQLQCRKVLPSFFLQGTDTNSPCGGTGQPAVSILGIKTRLVPELARADASAISFSMGITSPLQAGIMYFTYYCVYLACSLSSVSCESMPKPTQRIAVLLMRTLFSFSIN